MIAVDTSAIIAIIKDEPEAADFARILGHYDCMIGAPTALECHMVVHGSGNAAAQQLLDIIFAYPAFEIVPFSKNHLATAQKAFEKFGKGQENKASLNFGDCMAYALARVEGIPLLFKGDDFAHTDIEPAFRP